MVGLLAVIGFSVNSFAADSSSVTFEDVIRSQIRTVSHTPGEAPFYRPLPERLLLAAQQAGVSKSELHSALMKLIDDGNKAPPDERGNTLRGIASGAFSGLQELADATVVDQLTALAVAAPRQIRFSATGAAILVANREAIEKLPSVARQLLRNENPDIVYSTLHEILESHLPADPDARAKHVATIVGILKEGTQTDNLDVNRIRIDELLEKYDAAYRNSEERKRLLKELSGSENEYDRKYGVKMLREVFSISGEAAIAAIPSRVNGTSAMAAVKAAPVRPNSEPRERPPSFQWNSPPAIIGGFVVFVILVFLWWRAASK